MILHFLLVCNYITVKSVQLSSLELYLSGFTITLQVNLGVDTTKNLHAAQYLKIYNFRQGFLLTLCIFNLSNISKYGEFVPPTDLLTSIYMYVYQV